MLLAAPVLYLIIAVAIAATDPSPAGGELDVLFYILLIVGAVQPFLIPWLERVQLRTVEHRDKTARQVAALYLTTFILKAAFIEAVFIYGLVVYLLSKDSIERMLVFYAVGVVWTFVYWPTESRLHNFLERVGRYDGR